MGLGPRGERGAGCGAPRSRRWRPSPCSPTAGPAGSHARGLPGSPRGSVSGRVATRGPRPFPLCRGPGGARGCHPPPKLGAASARLPGDSPDPGKFPCTERRDREGARNGFCRSRVWGGPDMVGVASQPRSVRCVRKGQAKATLTRNLESGWVSADFRFGDCVYGLVFIDGLVCGVGLAGSNCEDIRFGEVGECLFHYWFCVVLLFGCSVLCVG